MIASLDVMLWGRKVGTLVAAKQGYTDRICFYFDPGFTEQGPDIAPLRASIHGVAARRQLPVYPEKEKIFGGLPSFIADSLPDVWGNMIFSEWAKAHGIRQKELTALDRLAYIGKRGMGALEFVPPSAAEMETPFRVVIAQLSEFARKALKEASDFHAVLNPDLAIESLFKVGTLAGGRRPKAVVNVDPGTGECYSGQVAAPAPGFIPMIVKFDEHSDIPTTRLEYSYYLMALDAGLHMMPSRLLEGESGAHFLTERFDRRGEEKIHTQTLAAMNPQAQSYEDLFEVATRLSLTAEERRQLFLQMVMNVVCGNVDDHSKNFSFMMAEDGVWRLAPAYDFTFTVDPSAPDYVNCHSLTVNGKNRDISREDLLAVAARHDIKGARGMIDKVQGLMERYPGYAERAGVPQKWVKAVGSGWCRS